jgi:hypothetical protein
MTHPKMIQAKGARGGVIQRNDKVSQSRPPTKEELIEAILLGIESLRKEGGSVARPSPLKANTVQPMMRRRPGGVLQLKSNMPRGVIQMMQMGNQDTCPICREDYAEDMPPRPTHLLNCGHRYHNSCLRDAWNHNLRNGRPITCFYCATGQQIMPGVDAFADQVVQDFARNNSWSVTQMALVGGGIAVAWIAVMLGMLGPTALNGIGRALGLWDEGPFEENGFWAFLTERRYR